MSFFSKLDQSTDDRFNFKGKVKFVFGTGELEDVQRMVERQIGALTLLLTACNWSESPYHFLFGGN